MPDSQGKITEQDDLLAILERMDDPAVLTDSSHTIVAANAAYRNRLAGGSEVVGKRCHQVSHDFDSPCHEMGVCCPSQRCRQTRQPHRVLHVHHSSSGKVYEDVIAYPVLGKNGTVRSAIEIIRPSSVASLEPDTRKLVGQSEAFNRMLELVHRVAPSDAAVLLAGESGTGKELVAEAIHRLGPRNGEPFVPVECSGLSEHLFESELFGHEKGSFTGADFRRTGLVEAAEGGTLFLDEIGDVPPSQQVKLLRLLETGRYRRVGSSTALRADFRLICASNRNLEELVAENLFRRDLFYRINCFPIRLPPLRERMEDLPLLCRSLLKRVCQGHELKVHPSALAQLQGYDFPGNVRELLNILERASLLADGESILPEHLPDSDGAGTGADRFRDSGEIIPLKRMEDRYLRWAVDNFREENSALANKLGISERTLYRKLRSIRKRGRSRTPVPA